jgi:hypothetical protein
MAATRAFLLSSSVALAAVGCGPVGGVEPGASMDSTFASPTVSPRQTAVETPLGKPSDVLPEGMQQGGPLSQASPENSG